MRVRPGVRPDFDSIGPDGQEWLLTVRNPDEILAMISLCAYSYASRFDPTTPRQVLQQAVDSEQSDEDYLASTKDDVAAFDAAEDATS